MRQSDLARFREWFDRYTMAFVLDDREGQKNIDLKIRHTSRVCGIIVRIAEGQSLGASETMMAETAALFHDIGRFEQYMQYRTFRDSISVNHGRLGADVLMKEHVLEGLPEEEESAVLNAVRFHNSFALPSLDRPEDLRLLQMVRDADKLDIWRIFLGFYEGDRSDIASEAGLGLPDLAEYSAEVISNIEQGKTASMQHLRTLTDFKLMLMSWVYDLNFIPSFRMLEEKDYLNRLASLVPETAETARIRASLLRHVEERLGSQ